MTRYYLSPIVGTGTRDDPYRAKVMDYGVAVSSLIPTDATGHPQRTWCLCLVEASDHSVVLADATVQALPDVGDRTTWQSVSRVEQQRLESALSPRGVTLSSTAQTEFREIVRQIGRAQDPSFHERQLRVRAARA